MQALYRVAILPGDGVGPEVTSEAVKVLKAVEEVTGPRFRFHTGLIGGCAVDATAVPSAVRSGITSGRTSAPKKDCCNFASA